MENNIKKLSRVKLREEAFKILFSLEFDEKKPEFVDKYTELNYELNKEDKMYLKQIILYANNEKEYLKEVIEKNIKETWEYKRISPISRALIKLAVIEIEYLEIPFKVTINECINLSKKYTEEKNTKFLNGVLATYINNIKDKLEPKEEKHEESEDSIDNI